LSRTETGSSASHRASTASFTPVVSQLANGLRLIAVPQPHLQGATVSLFVKVGPRYERRDKNGISHFLEHMLFRGTARHATPYELSYAAEALGGTLDAATYADFTHYQMSVPREHAVEAVELLGDLLAAPRFLDLALEQRIVKEEILADLDADGREVDAENLSRMLVFGDHPLGFKITGDVSNVESFTRADLHAHLEQHYGAANMALVATGSVEAAELFAAAERAFGSRPRGQITLVDAPPPPRHDRRLSFVRNDSSQSELRACFRAFGSDDPDFTALKLLVRILDDGMSTRLHQRLTDESGLAYEVFAGLDPYEEAGLVEIGASVEHDKLPEVLRAVLALMSELRDADVSQAELDKARARYRWNLRRITDSAEDMAMYAGTQAIFGRSIDLGGLVAELDRVTVSDVRNVARRLVRPEALHIVCVGRASKAVQKQAARSVAEWSARQRS
jgi:predicted Zn-dependent peptidase